MNLLNKLKEDLKKGKFKMAKLKKSYRFTTDNVFVLSWVSIVLTGKRTLDQVPKLFNLRECVKEVLELKEKEDNATNGQ